MKQSLKEFSALLDSPVAIKEESEIIRDIKVGQKIRSYDFQSNKKYYMEGIVYDISEGLYHCRGTKVVRDGSNRIGVDFRTPVSSWMDWDGRIEVI